MASEAPTTSDLQHDTTFQRSSNWDAGRSSAQQDDAQTGSPQYVTEETIAPALNGSSASAARATGRMSHPNETSLRDIASSNQKEPPSSAEVTDPGSSTMSMQDQSSTVQSLAASAAAQASPVQDSPPRAEENSFDRQWNAKQSHSSAPASRHPAGVPKAEPREGTSSAIPSSTAHASLADTGPSAAGSEASGSRSTTVNGPVEPASIPESSSYDTLHISDTGAGREATTKESDAGTGLSTFAEIESNEFAR